MPDQMPPKTLAALRQSIEHWERMASGNRNPDEDIGPNSCALCRMFNTRAIKGGAHQRLADVCRGCPVEARTGRQFCIDTPHEGMERAELDYDETCQPRDPHYYDTDDFKCSAREELEFLRSLLPQ